MTNGLFLYHRDFRLIDNKALLNAEKMCKKIYTCFIFTNEQVKKNKFKSENSVQFMIESLEDLQDAIKNDGGKLLLFHGNNIDILKELFKILNIDILFFNEDYTPYAKERIDKIKNLCKKNDVECETSHDYYITEPGTVINKSGTPYVRFNSFYESVFLEHEFQPPNKKKITKLASTTKSLDNAISLKDALSTFVRTPNENLAVHGGRKLAEKHLRDAVKNMGDYKSSRDDMSQETSMLSAYIKYGCLSIREVVNRFRVKFTPHHELIRQLVWRDFYMHILQNFQRLKFTWIIQLNFVEKVDM